MDRPAQADVRDPGSTFGEVFCQDFNHRMFAYSDYSGWIDTHGYADSFDVGYYGGGENVELWILYGPKIYLYA